LQLLGRSINLAGLIRQRMNKMFRENLDFLLERFESQDLCAIVVGAHFSLVFQL
jgi:cytoplasmic FMR1 interacting protein